MMREARLMLELRGTGWVPRPLALGLEPLTFIQEFVCEPYDKFLMQCSVHGVLRSLGQLCHRLGEVHARGVVHNDLKADNIIVSGGVHRPVLHVINLGWAGRAGRVAGDFSLETGEENDFSREGFGAECCWMAPEVKVPRPVFASGDVFSLSILLQELAESCIQPSLAVPLWRMGQRCASEDTSCRPCLPNVARAIAAARTPAPPAPGALPPDNANAAVRHIYSAAGHSLHHCLDGAGYPPFALCLPVPHTLAVHHAVFLLFLLLLLLLLLLVIIIISSFSWQSCVWSGGGVGSSGSGCGGVGSGGDGGSVGGGVGSGGGVVVYGVVVVMVVG
ncbi:hypothetical protein E2C01_056060 [Portunus trituberculatus]|uniref:Protein kinase domain-containing protein n=1 Tax=Portunus trituberculatus TaxID=210409 RepID=A0A5B7GPD2_PORTR|nr:hypothetical protein [Portunus trituberculatus]